MNLDYWFDTKLDSKTITVQLFGELYLVDFVKVNSEFRQKALKSNLSIIFDFRATNNQIFFNQINYLKEFVYITQFDNSKHLPVVHLINIKDKYIFDFIEVIANDNGLFVNTFYDELSAIEWLKQF